MTDLKHRGDTHKARARRERIDGPAVLKRYEDGGSVSWTWDKGGRSWLVAADDETVEVSVGSAGSIVTNLVCADRSEAFHLLSALKAAFRTTHRGRSEG